MSLIYFRGYNQWIHKNKHSVLDIVLREDGVESNFKGFILLVEWFLWPWHFEMIDHNTLSARISLHFDLASPNLRISVLCLTSNASETLRSDFLALVFLQSHMVQMMLDCCR